MKSNTRKVSCRSRPLASDSFRGARAMARRCLALILAMECACVATQAGEAIPSENQIASVMVMADRAEICRPGKPTVPQGVSSEVVQRIPPPPADKAALLKRINELNGRIDAIDASVLGLRRQVELARSYRGRTLDAIGLQALLPAEKLPQGKLDLESWGRALDALSEQELQSLNKARDLEVERFGLQPEMEELQQQIQQRAAPRVQEVRRALIGLSSPQGGAITFQLIYRVPGPTWRMRYDLRYDSNKNLLKVEGFGMIFQSTGEDWRDVDLTLSTRLPASGLRPPQIQTLVLSGQDTQAVRQELAMYAENIRVGEIAANPVQEAEQPPEPQPPKQVEAPKKIDAAALLAWKNRAGLNDFIALQSSLTGQTFRVLKRSTVLSGAEPQQVPILQASVAAASIFESVPKHSSTVYRRVTAKNSSGAPLLPGRATLFLDGGLVGIASIHAVAPGGDLALSFGALEGMSVNVSAQSGEEHQDEIVQLQRGKRTYRFTNRYELYNQTQQAIQVRVLDSVPVSEVKDVEVAIDRKASSKFDDLGNGILGFLAKAESKKTGKLELLYSVIVPENLKF